MKMSQKPPVGHFTLLYFATAATFTKKSWEHIPAPLELSRLFGTLESRYPGISARVLNSCAVTVNLEYVDLERASNDSNAPELTIQDGDEVAIIPPVSSG